MKQILAVLFLSLLSWHHAAAQSTFTDKLRQKETGKGTVVVNQSAEIERIVNTPFSKSAQSAATSKDKNGTSHTAKHESSSHATTPHLSTAPHTAESKNAKTDDTHLKGQEKTHINRTRHKARGFRICIFTGGNSRADKTKAMQMGQKCRQKFPELATYSSFVPPRWVTYVGDFRTRQEAQKYVSLIRRANFTYEVRIVSSEVNLPD